MPRVGSNPMKSLERRFVPKRVSACTLVYIPELSGYWAQSLDVLRVCLSSLVHNTGEAVDLIVLDNGSCSEVKEFLAELFEQGTIQLLIQSSSNMGKPGAWNTLMPACPGEYIAFCDSDVLFYPGWLRKSLEIFEAFEDVGMVTARPFRTARTHREALLGASLAKAAAGELGHMERGDLIPAPVLEEHLASLGGSRDKLSALLDPEDVRVTRNGVSAYVSANHYQFVTRRDVALQVLPLEGKQALAGDEREWDARINRLGQLRLSTTEALVQHLGNTLSADELARIERALPSTWLRSRRDSRPAAAADGVMLRGLRQLARVPHARKAMQKTYGALFAALQ